jgi:hypothetical protein
MSQGHILDLTILIGFRVAGKIVHMLDDFVELREIPVDVLAEVRPRLLSSSI